MYVQTTQKKRKIANPLLKRKPDLSVHVKKENKFLDEVETAASSTLIEEEKIVMIKHIKNMHPVCSIYDIDFQTLLYQHQTGAMEELSMTSFCPIIFTIR